MPFEISFENLLGWEGGFGNDPHDAGGPTNLGVIQEEYDRYRDKKGLDRQSVKHITRPEAEEIYRVQYWDATNCDRLNAGVANALFDADVNSGDRRGVTWLQTAVNALAGRQVLAIDGKCGAMTTSMAASLSAPQLIDKMLTLRLAFMHVARNSKTGEALWPTFGRGWQKRIDGVRKQSHQLCGVAAVLDPLPSPPLPLPATGTSKMSDLNPLFDLAKAVTPALATVLGTANPLAGVALKLVAAALDATEEDLPARAAKESPATLVTALRAAETALQTHAQALNPASPPAPPPPSSTLPLPSLSSPGWVSGSPGTQNVFIDTVSAGLKYVIGVGSVALLMKMGMTIDAAQGISANITPIIWSGIAGLITAGSGLLIHRTLTGSNAATAQMVSNRS